MRSVDEVDRELALLADLRGFLSGQMPGERVSTTQIDKLLDERQRLVYGSDDR